MLKFFVGSGMRSKDQEGLIQDLFPFKCLYAEINKLKVCTDRKDNVQLDNAKFVPTCNNKGGWVEYGID